MDNVDELIQIKRRVQEEYLARPSVTGISVGYKYVRGVRTESVAIRVHVRKKTNDISEEERVPVEIDGAATDVLERTFSIKIGWQEINIHPPNTQQIRPILGGISTGPVRRYNGYAFAGTVIGVFWDNVNLGPAAVTNFHVACLNDSWHVGDRQVQESLVDRAGIFDVPGEIGGVTRATRSNLVDGAVVSLDDGVGSTYGATFHLGATSGAVTAQLNMAVRKQGRTTGLTYGFIDAVDLSFTVDADDKTGLTEHAFDEQFDIRPDLSRNAKFSDHGDSGSGIIDENGHLVGLLMSGDAFSTQANPIAAVLEQLDLSFGPKYISASISPSAITIGKATNFTITASDSESGQPLTGVNVTVHNYGPPRRWGGGGVSLIPLPPSDSPVSGSATFYMGATVIDPRQGLIEYDKPPYFVVEAHGYLPSRIDPEIDNPGGV